MTWSGTKVRRRLQIPAQERLLAWARADEAGMRIPFPVTGELRRWPSYVALTEGALWMCRSGVTARFGLERVVMTALIDEPDGALRVDFLTGPPLVVLLSDGGSFVHALAREIRAFDRQLQRRAPAAPGAADASAATGGHELRRHPSRASDPAGPGGAPRPVSWEESPDARELLHEARLIVRRELRLVLTEAGTGSPGTWPG